MEVTILDDPANAQHHYTSLTPHRPMCGAFGNMTTTYLAHLGLSSGQEQDARCVHCSQARIHLSAVF